MVSSLLSVYIDSPQFSHDKKKTEELKKKKNLDYWLKDVINFEFLEKDLGIVSPQQFVYDFSRKTFLMLYSVNGPNSVT